MPQTVIQAIQDILRRRQARGQRSVWLSPANSQCLGKIPRQPLAGKAQSAPATITPPVRQSAAPAARPIPPPPTAAPISRTPFRQPTDSTANLPSAKPRDKEFLDTVANASLDELASLAHACSWCRLAATRQNVAFSDGCPRSRVMFIGEGPGADEDAQGVPFVGRAGQLLTNIIKAMGLDRTSADPARGVYIANIVKCRPPQNRNPLADEADSCLPFLKRQIALVQPEVIVLLGGVALKALLGKTGINRLRGHWFEYEGIPVMPTFHPSYLLHCERQQTLFIEEKRKVWLDMQAVMQRLGLPLPQRNR